MSIPWDFSETNTKNDGPLALADGTEWDNIGFSFTDYLNAPVNSSNTGIHDTGSSFAPNVLDMQVNSVNIVPASDSNFPNVNTVTPVQAGNPNILPENGNESEKESEKENEGLDRSSRSRRPTTSKEFTAIWRESAYAYFCQEIDSEEWKNCIDLWLEFERNEESGLETNSVSIYPSL
jgi:hypothetical protein